MLFTHVTLYTFQALCINTVFTKTYEQEHLRLQKFKSSVCVLNNCIKIDLIWFLACMHYGT